MILEKRATRWIPKATPPQQKETTSSDTAGEGTGGKDKDKPTEKNPAMAEEEKGDRQLVTVDGDGDGGGHGKTAELAAVAKSGPAVHVTVQQTVDQQMSPTSAQETRKLTYNPITHAPSTYESK